MRSLPSSVLVSVDLPAPDEPTSTAVWPGSRYCAARRRSPRPFALIAMHGTTRGNARAAPRCACVGIFGLVELGQHHDRLRAAALDQQPGSARCRRGLKSPSRPQHHEHGVDVGRDELALVTFAGSGALIAVRRGSTARCGGAPCARARSRPTAGAISPVQAAFAEVGAGCQSGRQFGGKAVTRPIVHAVAGAMLCDHPRQRPGIRRRSSHAGWAGGANRSPGVDSCRGDRRIGSDSSLPASVPTSACSTVDRRRPAGCSASHADYQIARIPLGWRTPPHCRMSTPLCPCRRARACPKSATKFAASWPGAHWSSRRRARDRSSSTSATPACSASKHRTTCARDRPQPRPQRGVLAPAGTPAGARGDRRYQRGTRHAGASPSTCSSATASAS